jgi:hypothetical protein
MKASGTKNSKGLVVLTTPSFGGLPKNLFFQIFQMSNRQKDCKTLKFRKCPKTGQLNRLYNHLIYKAFSKTGKASSILASSFNPLAYKALSVLLKACPYTFFRPLEEFASKIWLCR